MKSGFVLAFLILGCGCGLRAQAVVDTTVCDVVKAPAKFDGKIVRIKGTVVAGFDEFAIKDATQDPNCGFQVNGIWLSYPPGTKGKAGAVAMVEVQPAHNFAGTYKAPARAPVTLDKSKDFKQFDNLLSQPHQKGLDMCLGCTRYEVTATLIGRLDGVADATLKRDASGKIVGFGGFGNMNAYPARLVLQSVSDIAPKEVDYSKTDAITKGETPPAGPPTSGSQFDDPFGNAVKMGARLAGNPTGDMAQKAAAVFPKPKEENGVTVTFGMNNEADPNYEEMGAHDSPDGVLFNCWFYRDRLDGDALNRAIFHIGEHVMDLRSPHPGFDNSPIGMEGNAWAITDVAAISSRQKYLTLPGGYMLWDSAWPAAERDSKMQAAMKDFLSNEALLSQ